MTDYKDVSPFKICDHGLGHCHIWINREINTFYFIYIESLEIIKTGYTNLCLCAI